MPKKKGRSPDKGMIVAVGSKNAAKTIGVRRAFSALASNIALKEIDVSPLVKIQPMSLDETVEGAHKRAKLALKSAGADFGVGVEAGLVGLGQNWRGHYLNLQVAAVVDAAGHLSFGSSSGFPLPPRFIARMEKDRQELDSYTHELTGAGKVREEHGIVYHLSGRRLSRVEMTEQCVSMALIPWLNGKLYDFK